MELFDVEKKRICVGKIRRVNFVFIRNFLGIFGFREKKSRHLFKIIRQRELRRIKKQMLPAESIISERGKAVTHMAFCFLSGFDSKSGIIGFFMIAGFG